jgi:hypothetical protein
MFERTPRISLPRRQLEQSASRLEDRHHVNLAKSKCCIAMQPARTTEGETTVSHHAQLSSRELALSAASRLGKTPSALAVLSLLLMAGPALATTYYVQPNGSDSASGTSPKSAWRSISFAMSNSSPVRAGDEVQVAAGIYPENVDIKKSGAEGLPITLKGIGDVVVMDPTPDAGPGEGVIDIIGAKHVVVDNIAVENAYFFGYQVRGSENVVLQRVRTHNTGASGIIVATNKRTSTVSSNIKILNSEVSDSCMVFSGIGQGGHEAISIASANGFEVAYNSVHGGLKEGITAKGSARNGVIHHNTVFDQARVGIYVGALGGTVMNVEVHNNLVYRNAHGIAAVNEGNGHTENVSIFNNVVYSNLGRGIGVAPWGVGPDHDVNDIKIINNTVAKNGTIGILVDNPEASNVLIRNNVSYMNAIRAQIRVTKGQAVVERNVVTDPHFRNALANDFSLKSDSPAIDAGFDALAPAADFVGQKRPMGLGPDAGAYEIR